MATNPDGTLPDQANQAQVNTGNVAPVQESASASALMSMDANGDGVLTRAEYLSTYERQYDAMEKNTIGAVDLRRLAESGEQ